MRRLMQALIRLYPASWRSRYATEFSALLEDITPTARTLLDIVGGAIAMQLRTPSPLKLVVTTGLVGLAVGSLVWLATPNFYRSSATFVVQPEQATDALVAQERRLLTGRQQLHTDGNRIIVQSDSPARVLAHAVTTNLVSKFIDDSMETGACRQCTLKIVAAPTIPQHSLSPSPFIATATGLLAGLAITCLLRINGPQHSPSKRTPS